MKNDLMNSKIQIIVPSEWDNYKRGTFFEEVVAKIFIQMQYKVSKQIRVTGMEIDLLAKHLYSKESAYIECKFKKNTFGAPVINKLIGNAILRDDISIAYLVSTAEPGKDAKGVLEELDKKNFKIRELLSFAYIGPSEFVRLFLSVNQYPKLEEKLVEINLGENVSSATLVITPDVACWVIEKQEDGIPRVAHAMPLEVKKMQLDDFEAFKRLVEDNKMWTGLRISNGIAEFSSHIKDTIKLREVVTSVPVAENFDDTGPARPQDFVGRLEIQREIFRFFQRVLQGQTNKRVIALSGPSGFGKSSTILKLADRTRNKHYRNKYRIYHIDSRSATSPLFVIEAIRTVFQNAIEDKFINLPDSKICIDSVEDPFSSHSMANCLLNLKNQNRLMLVFIDQFEELLTKEALFNTFEVFKKIAFLVEDIQQNLIIGFSWRTRISFSEDHPAYHMWHSLQDKRAEFKIGLFSSQEASEMLIILEKNLNEKLDSSLGRHLLEQSQGFPWLLKKFCIHVYRQLSTGTDQRSLIGRKLDATILFEEDTRDLSSAELSCLEYIAKNSPVDIVKVQDTFGPEMLERLYHLRLVIKSGFKCSLYWDIFREYLISGNVPHIPMTFFPQAQLSTCLSVLRHIIKEGPITVKQIENYFAYTTKTVWNIVGDLATFFLITRNSNDKYDAVPLFKDISSFEDRITDYVGDQLKRHVVLNIFYDNVQPLEEISQTELEYLVWEVYPSYSLITLHAYINRLISWLRFTGLMEVEQPNQIKRPVGRGKDRGKVVIRHRKQTEGQALFLCTSSPNRVIDLATELCLAKTLSREHILNTEGRNAAGDLTALGLAKWKNKTLYPINSLENLCKDIEGNMKQQCVDMVKVPALESNFLQIIAINVNLDPNLTNEEIVKAVSSDFGRGWHPNSARRYINGGLRWLDFFGVLQKIHGQRSLFEL